MAAPAQTLPAVATRQSLPLPATVDLVALDFDGVLTDDRVLVLEDGREAVCCSRADGMGIALLREAGYRVMVFSGETNPVVSARCAKLGVEVRQGLQDKRTAVAGALRACGGSFETLVFVGNDVNDLECLAQAACSLVPRDAHPRAVAVATAVLHSRGGRGAVREVADHLLAAHRSGACRPGGG